jgi:hypothetical protein
MNRLRVRLAACWAAEREWTHGIVYALRLDETFLPHLSFDANGLACRVRIAPDRIFGKAIIPPEAAGLQWIPYARQMAGSLELEKMLQWTAFIPE